MLVSIFDVNLYFIGPVDLEVKTFGDTLIPIPYVDVNRRRVERRVSASNVGARTFILTVASEETSGLRALLTSAYLAGVSIEVRAGVHRIKYHNN